MKQTQEKRTLLDRVIKWPQAGIVLALIILYLILAFAPTPIYIFAILRALADTPK